MTSTERDDEGKAKWAPGEMADGSISVMTVDEARAAIVQRNADEEEFDKALDGMSPEAIKDDDDFSDLDDPLPEER